jgi:transmembrane sensor
MTKDLFIKYLQGNCSEEEFEQIMVWIKEGALVTSEKGMIQEVWDEFESEAGPLERIKYKRVLDRIHHQISRNQNFKPLINQKNSTKNRIFSIITRAAAILLIPVLTILLYTTFSGKDQYAKNINDFEVEAPAGSKIKFELGDGTKVWLNHGSTLKYPYHFEGKDRKVFLTGEAYFEVAHNKDVPFIVGTNRIEVKATGTAFNVSAYPDDDMVETTLVEGRVILYEPISKQEVKVLLPNESLKFNTQNNNYVVETGNTAKNTSWKDGLLVFRNEPLEVIAKKLARWYNVEVEITNEKVKKYTYTATFSDETLSQVLDLMTLPTPVSYKLTAINKLPDGSFTKQKVTIGIKNIK